MTVKISLDSRADADEVKCDLCGEVWSGFHLVTREGEKSQRKFSLCTHCLIGLYQDAKEGEGE